MTEIRFYHLTRTGLEKTLPELLEMTLGRGWRAVVKAASADRAESLTHHLWTYKPDSFLPHGNAKDGNAENQPVWVTDKDERPNGASILFLTDGAESAQIGDYIRVCEVFDGNDDAALATARQHWVGYKAAGHELSYWQQDERSWVNRTPA